MKHDLGGGLLRRLNHGGLYGEHVMPDLERPVDQRPAVGRSVFIQAADSTLKSQPGKTSTAGWHLRARAMTFARSTPRLTRLFSIAEIVDCGIPESLAN